MADGDWKEAGGDTSQAPVGDHSLLSSLNIDDFRLTDNAKFQQLSKELADLQKNILKDEKEGRLYNYVENPSLLGDYLGKLRLRCAELYSFSNLYIDILSDLQREYALKRQELYVETLNKPKGSPSGAEKHAREMTRIDESKIGFIENCLQQVKNEYQRYDGICIYLQSRMKEFNTERMTS